ncbi:MAG: BamA/TamA family outer membrane protein [Candidatus Marinimicrobia bacterium]|nr:BamA/TamA family outer membrane protein [Candidatus Neomarinimicrobiota bacterium]
MKLTHLFFIFSLIPVSLTSQITDIKIVGNKHSHEEIILREINHPIPGAFDSTIALEDRNRIYNLGLFSTVDIRQIDSSYTITLVETIRFLPIPIVDYNEAKGWSYGGGIAFLNFKGMNQKLILGGIGGEETTYFLNYNDPWVTGDHVSLLGNVYKLNTKNSVYSYHYKERGVNIGTGFYINKVHKFNFLLGLEAASIDTTGINNSHMNYKPNDILTDYGYIRGEFGYTFDERDIYLDPTSGEKFSFYFKPKISMGNSENYYRFQLGYSKYYQLSEKYLNPVFSANSKLYLQYSKVLPIFEYLYLGGEDYVRGYSPLPDSNATEISHLIEGFNIIYQSFQLQHTLFEKKDFSGVELGIDMVYFSDFGISADNITSFKLQEMLIGFGIGFRFFASGAGVIGIDFGFNPYGQWFIHLSDSN